MDKSKETSKPISDLKVKLTAAKLVAQKYLAKLNLPGKYLTKIAIALLVVLIFLVISNPYQPSRGRLEEKVYDYDLTDEEIDQMRLGSRQFEAPGR